MFALPFKSDKDVWGFVRMNDGVLSLMQILETACDIEHKDSSKEGHARIPLGIPTLHPGHGTLHGWSASHSTRHMALRTCLRLQNLVPE
jgi:hypothetical protein